MGWPAVALRISTFSLISILVAGKPAIEQAAPSDTALHWRLNARFSLLGNHRRRERFVFDEEHGHGGDDWHALGANPLLRVTSAIVPLPASPDVASRCVAFTASLMLL